MTIREAREVLRPMGWRLTGNRQDGYVLLSLPTHGDVSSGPYATPADAVQEARDWDKLFTIGGMSS